MNLAQTRNFIQEKLLLEFWPPDEQMIIIDIKYLSLTVRNTITKSTLYIFGH